MVMSTNEPPVPPADRDAALGSVMQFLELRVGKRGSRLPPERELAATLNLSRARLRVCLKALEERGLIWRHVGMGTFFGPRPPNLGGPLSSLAERTNPQEVMEARLTIEPELARMATIRARQSDIDEMKACLEEMCRTENTARWLALDSRLHRTIARAAGNALMSVLLEAAQDHRDKRDPDSGQDQGFERTARRHRFCHPRPQSIRGGTRHAPAHPLGA
jgi:DNA-binding FadR family transcriptional regulator